MTQMGEDDTDETKTGIYEGYTIRVHELAYFLHRLKVSFLRYLDLVPPQPGFSHVIPHVNQSKPKSTQCTQFLRCNTMRCTASQQQQWSRHESRIHVHEPYITSMSPRTQQQSVCKRTQQGSPATAHQTQRPNPINRRLPQEKKSM